MYLFLRVIELAGINTKGIGTPFYMCPEVIQGVPYDQKVTTCVKQNLKTSEDNESDQITKKIKMFYRNC